MTKQCSCVLLPTFHHTVHDSVAELSIAEVSVKLELAQLVESEHQVSDALHGLPVACNHQVQIVTKLNDFTLHILQERKKNTNHINSTVCHSFMLLFLILYHFVQLSLLHVVYRTCQDGVH